MPIVQSSRSKRALAGSAVAVAIAVAGSILVRAATPTSGTLSPTSAPVTWDSFGSLAASSPQGETTCVEGVNCDTFTLHLAPADYTGLRVRYRATWTNQVNDYDLYIHQGDLTGPAYDTPNGGAPSTS